VKTDVAESKDPTVEVCPDDRLIFERLYGQHFEAIYAYVLRRAGTADTADLVADVFATAWRRIADVPAPPDSRMWLYGVARRVVSQSYRTNARRDHLNVKLGRNFPSVARDEPPEVSDLEVKVLGLIENLKDDDRELVTLIAWDGLTHAEVATVLGCSVNAIGIRWHRALKGLRRDLGAEPMDSPHRPNHPLLKPLTEES
jgi:RNA polymerase sigma-70 factor (ECF subfamily)